MKNKSISIYEITAVGLMAALVFVSSHLSIPIPTAIDNTRIHLGNVFCLLSGLLLGGWKGGLAAGIGSAFFDLFNPLYISSAPFTLVFKFAMGFLAGQISHTGGRKGRVLRFNTIGSVTGALTYVVLYLGKSFLSGLWFKKVELATALADVGLKSVASLTNAVIAVAVAVPLGLAVEKALRNTPLGKKLGS